MYSQMNLIEEWASLERPILIERVATSDVVVYNVHVSCSSGFIRSINITGDYTYQVEYSEDDGVMETVVTFNTPNNTGVDMAEFMVTVVDFDDITYKKGYPENDVVVGDVYDHDEYIDNLGLILNLPRKRYISYPIASASLSTPPFYGKEVENGVVQPCTEDDYYYLQRLKQLREHMHDRNIGALLLDLMYGYKDVVVTDSTILDNQQLIDNITEQYPDFEDNIQPGVYVFLIPEDNPSNYESINMQGKQDFIDKYIPVTRYSVLANTIHTTMTINDVSPRPTSLPGANRNELYLSDYTFDVLGDGEERVNTPCQLTYTLDSYAPVLVDYDTGESTTYRDTHLLRPGLHVVTVDYPATLGYEACNSIYTFKTWIDASHDFVVPFPNYYPYYTMDGTSGENTIQSTSQGRIYTRDTSDEYDVFRYNMGMITKDNMIVLEYIVEGYNNTEYLFGVWATGQGYTKNSNPTRELKEPLTGRHRVSIELPRGYIYVDGVLAELDKKPNKAYTYNHLFLRIPQRSASAKILESRACQFLPYYKDDESVYHPNEFLDWQEYTIRAVVDTDAISSGLSVFYGLGTTGLRAELPALSKGRHTIDMQLVNNHGYLYVDDTPVGVMYDYDTCKQYSYTVTGDVEDDFTVTRTDLTMIFNTPCDFELIDSEPREQIISVGICPTTLRGEIEEHTPVRDITLTCSPDVDVLMQHLVAGYSMHFDVSCTSIMGNINVPLTLDVGGVEYTIPAGSTSTTVSLSDDMIHDTRIYYRLYSPPGRYYHETSTDGYIQVTGIGQGVFLDYVELVAGETCTLTARIFDGEGNPLTSRQNKSIFKVGGKSVQQDGAVATCYPDMEGVITLEYTVPANLAGKTRTVQAVVLNKKTGILESNIRTVTVR